MIRLFTKQFGIRIGLLVIAYIFLFPFSVLASESVLEWKKVKDKDGIQIYRAHTEDSRFKTFKAVTRMEIENIQAFVGLFLDKEAYGKWLHMVTGAELVPTGSPDRNELYIKTRLPWPVKDRFTKADAVISQKEDYSVRLDLYKPEVPAKERKGYILAPVSKGYYELQVLPDSKEVEVTVEILVDPGGYVPAFFVNLITDDMTYYSVRKFKRIIQSEQYQNYQTELVERRPWVLVSNERI